MNLRSGITFLSLMFCSLAVAAPLPEGGRSLLDGSKPHAVVTKGGEAKATHEPRPELGEVWRFEISKPPPNSWNVQLAQAVKGNIAEGDCCLLSFQARSLDGKKASGTNNVEIQLPPDYTKVGQGAFTVGAEWTTVYTPFTAKKSVPDGKGSVAIHLGGALQTVEIAQLQLLNYGAGFDMAKMPRTPLTYEGREPNAPWRAAAMKRIQELRTGPMALEIVDAAGKPVVGAEVKVELKRHAFGFGSAVTGKMLADTTADGEKYRALVDENFSKVVFENDLKPFAWDIYKGDNQGDGFRKQWLDESLAWLAARHIPVRGHYMAWGPFEPWSEKLRATPEAIREKVFEQMKEKISVVGDRVVEWDALNHPVAWEKGICVDSVLGASFYPQVFKLGRELTKLPLWINEDQVFRPGRQQEEYFTVIQQLLAAGIKIDGIGNQAHFHASFLPSPEELLANSDRFAKLVPALQLTEFDVNTDGDDQLAADFTRDLLIVCYSHPAYTGFVMWGFWEGRHWKPETALWRKDWTIKPNGKVWQDLVCGQWKTKADLKTDVAGKANLTGHFGRYEISVTKDGRTSKQDVELVKGKSGPLQVMWK